MIETREKIFDDFQEIEIAELKKYKKALPQTPPKPHVHSGGLAAR